MKRLTLKYKAQHLAEQSIKSHQIIEVAAVAALIGSFYTENDLNIADVAEEIGAAALFIVANDIFGSASGGIDLTNDMPTVAFYEDVAERIGDDVGLSGWSVARNALVDAWQSRSN